MNLFKIIAFLLTFNLLAGINHSSFAFSNDCNTSFSFNNTLPDFNPSSQTFNTLSDYNSSSQTFNIHTDFKSTFHTFSDSNNKFPTDSIKKSSPLIFNASYIGEFVTNHYGGIRTGTVYQGMANIMLSFDTKKARLWEGGQFYINAAHTHGGDPSAEFIGDFQITSNIEADNLTYFHEMWYSQKIGRADIIIGLQDLNAEFLSSEYCSLFLNSSFGVHSTIADNINAPIFPLTAFGVQLKYNFNAFLSVKLITFDGFPDDFSQNNPYNLRWSFKNEDGLLNIAEITWQPRLKQRLPGKYSVGSYTHHHISSNDVNDHGIWEITNYGFYIVGDQKINQYSNGSSLSLFLQASLSPYQKNENWYYLGCGLNYLGLFREKEADVFGIAIAHAGFDNPHKNETTFELTYKTQINNQLYFQPDIQYVINPSGTEDKLRNALVSSLRFIIEL